MRDEVRGVYGFSSLVKQNKKAKICFVIYIAGFFFKKNFCYEVIVKQIFYKRSSNYYSQTHTSPHPVYPSLHTQLASAPLPGADVVLPGHARQ